MQTCFVCKQNTGCDEYSVYVMKVLESTLGGAHLGYAVLYQHRWRYRLTDKSTHPVCKQCARKLSFWFLVKPLAALICTVIGWIALTFGISFLPGPSNQKWGSILVFALVGLLPCWMILQEMEARFLNSRKTDRVEWELMRRLGHRGMFRWWRETGGAEGELIGFTSNGYDELTRSRK